MHPWFHRSLREHRIARAVGHALQRAARRNDRQERPFRVVHFGIEPDHFHLVVEASDRLALARGVAGLCPGSHAA